MIGKIYILLGILFVLIGNRLSAQTEAFEELKSLEIIDQIYENLDLHFVDEVQHGKLAKAAIDAMLKELDPYTVYYHEANIEDYKLMTTGQYGGIGALIGMMDGAVYITEPYEGKPAQKMGIRAGDKIISIDKKSSIGKSTDEVSGALRGPKGTKVEVEIAREGKPFVFTITREEIQLPDVPYAGMVSKNIGYLSLSSFTQTAAESVRKNLVELKNQGMEKLILDLRGNGGGLLMEAVKIVGFFVPKGQSVVTTKSRNEKENMTYKTLENPIVPDMPLVVLIDENSASASEIVAGSLQDLDRAVIVGSTSFGKGLVQRTFDLKYGSKIKLTISKYYTPSGRCVQRLEYYDKAEGMKPKEIPDSLLQKFYTKNGRPVIDGRGIEPDVVIKDSVYSKYVQGLKSKNLIFFYVNQFVNNHQKIENEIDYTHSEQGMNEFKAFVQAKNFVVNTPDQKLLASLKTELLASDNYQVVKEEMERLDQKVQELHQKDFEKNYADIKALLEQEIIGRYYFQKGQIIRSFKSDNNLKESIRVLEDKASYNNLLRLN
jgi:carboxyl-terminal processing protease